MIVKEINHIVHGCPSRWDGKLDDGRTFYIKYRWGYLSVHVSNEVTDDLMAPLNDGVEVMGVQIDPSGWDGVMSGDEMIKIVSEVFKFEES